MYIYRERQRERNRPCVPCFVLRILFGGLSLRIFGRQKNCKVAIEEAKNTSFPNTYNQLLKKYISITYKYNL